MKPNFSAPRETWFNRADKIGSVLSSLCAVHCLCMPVLVGLLPVMGLTFFGGHKFECAACVTMIVFAAACVWAGCRVHRQWGLLLLLGAGAALVGWIQFGGVPDENEARTDWHEALAMMLGGALIAAAHLINLKLRARCHCAQCEAEKKISAPAKGIQK